MKIILFFTIGILVMPNLSATPKLNNSTNEQLIKICSAFPLNWQHNYSSKWLPGSVDTTDPKTVKLIGSDKGVAHFFCALRAKAADGDKIEFKIKAKGNGLGGAGLYQYPQDGSWKWNGGIYKSFKVSEKVNTYKVTLTVKGFQPTGQVCLVLWAGKNSEVIVESIKVKKL